MSYIHNIINANYFIGAKIIGISEERMQKAKADKLELLHFHNLGATTE